MRFSWTDNGYNLDQYLNRVNTYGHQKVRPLTAKELDVILKMRKTYSEMGHFITQLITIRAVIEKSGNSNFYAIDNNLRTTIHSLVVQRKKMWVVKIAYSVCKPKPEEERAVKNFIDSTLRRMDFVQKAVIEENIALTPIPEYLAATGAKDIWEDLINRFPVWFELFKANREEDGKDIIKKYAEDIFETAKKLENGNAYQERLKKYLDFLEKKRNSIREEKEEEERKKNRKIAREGMDYFRIAFNDAVIDFKDDKDICISKKAIWRCIQEYGRGSVYVLCCYAYQGKPVFRYLGETEKYEKYFTNAKVFLNPELAEKAVQRMQDKWPDRIFETIELSHVEEEVV